MRRLSFVLSTAFALLAFAGCDLAAALLAPIGGVGAIRATSPYLQMEDASNVVVSWFTPIPLPGALELQSLANADLQWTYAEDTPLRHHSIRLENLASGETYRYRLTGPAATDTAWHEFRMNPPTGQRIVLAVLGDSGVGLPAQFAVANQIAASDADFVLHAGDVVYPAGADFDYDRAVFLPFRVFMPEKPFLPCIGNHDVATLDAAAYLENFILPRNGPAGMSPERCYSIDLGDVHLASLDLTRDPITTAAIIIPWLRSDMQAINARWKIVMFHFPVYTSGTSSRPPDPARQAFWGGLMDELRIDLCIAGHNHFYERSHSIRAGNIVPSGEGTVYLVSGNGGAPVYRLAERPAEIAASNDSAHGFTRISFEGPRIDISHVTDVGTVIDEVAWEKP